MKLQSKIYTSLLIGIFLFSFDACERGYIRSSLKERFQKKMKEQPAPLASSDRTQTITTPGDYVFSIVLQDIPRYYKVHVPKSYSGSNSVPLLFVFHGGGGDMEIQSKEEFYHQISKSE